MSSRRLKQLALLSLGVQTCSGLALCARRPDPVQHPAGSAPGALGREAPRCASPQTAFIENGGQWPIEARFVAVRPDMALRAGPKSLGLQCFEQPGSSRSGVLVDLAFVDACADVTLEGCDEQPGLHHYYFGEDPSGWVRDMHAYGGVRYRQLWPGVDLVLYEGAQGFEYDFELAAGASADVVRIRADGALALSVDAEGALVLDTASGPIYQPKPRAFQVRRSGEVEEVDCHYLLFGGLEFGLLTPDRNPDLPLVIDPSLLWATYIGGGTGPAGGGDGVNSMDVDDQRNIYLTGFTDSLDFPLTPGAYNYGQPTSGTRFMFITKLAADGASLIYSAWLSGGGDSRGTGIAADSFGQASVCGWTHGVFPTTPGAFDTVLSSFPGGAGVVLRLDATGSNLVYCTYLEGSYFCGGTMMDCIDVAPSGAVVVGGQTGCTSAFPTTPGCFLATTAIGGATLTRLDPTGSTLEWSTYFPALPTIYSLVVDEFDEVTFTGQVGWLPFPITPGVFGQTLPSFSYPNIFVTRMNTSGSAVVWSTYVSIGSPRDIALDGERGVVICGYTESSDFLTTPGALQTELNIVPGVGGRDGFVCRISPDATQLVYSSYLGGYYFDAAYHIDCTSSGIATVTVTPVGDATYPVTAGAYDTSFGIPNQIGITRLDPTGSKLYYSTFLGGPGLDYTGGLSIAPDGRALVAGSTTGAFPVTPGSYDTTYNGGALDLFAAEMDLFLVGVDSYGVSTPAICAPGSVYLNGTRMPKTGDSRFGFYCTGAPRGVEGWLLFGTPSATGTNIGGATLWLDPTQHIERRSIQADHLGFLEFGVSLTNEPPGSTFACQALFLNPPGCTATSPFSASNALVITVQP